MNYFNNYIIAIPTYKRHDILQTHTLETLLKNNIPSSKIYLFVANKTEYQIYKSNILDTKYHKIIIGKKGLKNQRNFITNYFPEEQPIVQLDDDIKEISELYQVKSTITKTKQKRHYRLKPIHNLDEFIKSAFKYCYENKAYLWGIYPVANPYFMTPTISTDLKFIVGPMWGVFNRHDKDLKATIDEKENVERSIRYFIKDNKVIRFNNITIKTRYYKTPGGMQSEKKNRKEEAMKSAIYLVNKYPQYAKLHLTKKSGHPEVKLINPTNK